MTNSMTENSWREFLGQMKIVKEVGALRKKGIPLEEVFQWLKRNGNFVEQEGWYPEGNCCGYHEQSFTGLIGKINVRVAWANATIGTPTLSVAVNSKKEWAVIRQSLRDAGFIR